MMNPLVIERNIYMRTLHPHQEAIRASRAKRKIIRAGRRGGKTVGVAQVSVDGFNSGRRVLYAAPTAEQIDTWWREVKRALVEPISDGMLYKNETLHIIEERATDRRLRGKTAWNADTLRGDYADLLILDEWQLMDEEAWSIVGAPMLLDNNGDAIFVYTPPSLRSRSASKARDPRHAAKMFAMAQDNPRWEVFAFPSHANPYLSVEALDEIAQDMTKAAYRQEIEAIDEQDVPGALWSASLIESTRVATTPNLIRVVVGVDPPGGATECGIVTVGKSSEGDIYIWRDGSLQASPDKWAGRILDEYEAYQADRVVAEANYGGDMVESTIKQASHARGVSVSYKAVHATRGKAVRAEPVAAMFEQGRAHIVGEMPLLEEELTGWVPGEGNQSSPNRLDAMVWACTELMDSGVARVRFI